MSDQPVELRYVAIAIGFDCLHRAEARRRTEQMHIDARMVRLFPLGQAFVECAVRDEIREVEFMHRSVTDMREMPVEGSA